MTKKNKKELRTRDGGQFTAEQMNIIAELLKDVRAITTAQIEKKYLKKVEKVEDVNKVEKVNKVEDVNKVEKVNKVEDVNKVDILMTFFKNSEDKELKAAKIKDVESINDYFVYIKRVFTVAKGYKSDDYEAKEIKSVQALNAKASANVKRAINSNKIIVLPYTTKTLAVLGDSKSYRAQIKALGAIWSRSLCVNLEKYEGWLVDVKKIKQLEEILQS